MNSSVQPFTLGATVNQRPRDAWAYIVLDDGSPEVAACLHRYRELLARHYVQSVYVEKGRGIADMASALVSPMIVAVVNKSPAHASGLPADLETFCAKAESYLRLMLPEYEQPR